MIVERRTLAGIVALFALAACETAPAKQSVEFVRGCWVSKQPFGLDATIFLRLLPPVADAPAYEGKLAAFAEGKMQPGGGRVSFARDGSRATFFLDEGETMGGADLMRTTSPKDWLPQRWRWRAFYVSTTAPPGVGHFVVEGDGEHLTLTVAQIDRAEDKPLFEFERDGCD